MSDKFIEQSEEIANNFIQNIVFIDDKAYNDNTVENAFNASEISITFAKAGKICAIYAPSSTSDIENYKVVLRKADVVILDWYIPLNDKEKKEDPEADAEADDPRGEFTLNLITDLLSEVGRLKLIIVYTGETNLLEITDNIYKSVDERRFRKDNCEINSLNSKIVIRAKSQNIDKFAHIPELKDKIVSYEELPALIIKQFTDLTNGLLSNFALSSISVIRDNTSRILSVFSPQLDPAYLGHKILLENTEDSKHLLIKIFGDAMSELLESANIDTESWIDNWIDKRITDGEKNINGKNRLVTRELLKKAIKSDRPNINEKLKEAEAHTDFPKDINKYSSELFSYPDINIEDSNIKFAELTHHKNVFLPITNAPILTLGTIVKDKDERYYICIQQRCDSVRIEKERRFLFLPLVEDGKDSLLILNSKLKLSPNYKSYEIKTIKFMTQNGLSVIQASKVDGKYIFKSSYDEIFEWVVDLKELHAQRISNSYCSNLSRVGLDESEWLRLLSKKDKKG